jgi:hypothetical protein
MIEMENVNAAAGATSIENDGIRATGFFIRRNFATNEGIISDRFIIGTRRHHIENECDEKDRDRDNEKSSSESIDLIGD